MNITAGAKLNGLDLFSGIAGLSLALGEWVRPIAYCENDRYAQSVLLSRMANGLLPKAPVWDDVRTLGLAEIDLPVDIIYGGFPCQDISVAGAGKGLAGSRSGLYFEIERLIQETKPAFVFLENVPAIRTRGLGRVVWGLSELGYDCRWTIVSAAEVGAPHLRKRWFLLAHANGLRLREKQRAQHGECPRSIFPHDDGPAQPMANASSFSERESTNQTNTFAAGGEARDESLNRGWWQVEPNVGRVVDGLPARVDRLRGLGNAVTPLQAKTAFERLMGLSA